MSDKRREFDVDLLYNVVELTASIRCTNCGVTDTTIAIDEYESADTFYDRGWLATIYGNAYCPDCAKKKLKRKKNGK